MTIEPARAERLGATVSALERGLTAAARAVGRVALALAIAGLVGAALIAAYLFTRTDEPVLAGVLTAVLAVPAVILGLFFAALRELAEVPERLRRLPQASREHADELAALAAEARGGRRPVVRAARLLLAAQETLTPWAPLLALASGPFLVATAISALVAPAELLAGLVLLAI